MNKLVSKNPVQRFKEGKKIAKAQFGNIIQIDSENDIWQDKSTGKKYQRNWRGRRWNRTPQGTSSNDFGNYFQEYSPSVPQQRIGMNGKPIVDTVSSPQNTNNNLNTKEYIPVGGVQAMRQKYLGKSNMDVAKEETHNYLEGLRNKYSRPFQKNNSSVKTVTPVDNYYLKGFEKRKDEIAKLGGVRAVQKMLGFTTGNGLDGKWGRDTEAAYQKYLIANAAKTPSLEDTINAAQNQPILSTPTINPSEYTFTESQLSGLGENPYYEPHPELRFNNFDRTQTRQWLRDNGFNPYSLTGAQRKALRMILNGQGTDEDKNLIGLTNGLSEVLTNYKYLKQGGTMNILPSRNIVERFKQKNFR